MHLKLLLQQLQAEEAEPSPGPAQFTLPTLGLSTKRAREKPAEPRGRQRAHLVGNAVENLHGQVRDIGIGVGSEVKEHSPNLGVNAVETHT